MNLDLRNFAEVICFCLCMVCKCIGTGRSNSESNRKCKSNVKPDVEKQSCIIGQSQTRTRTKRSVHLTNSPPRRAPESMGQRIGGVSGDGHATLHDRDPSLLADRIVHFCMSQITGEKSFSELGCVGATPYAG